jgi:hypothetical protein
MSFLRLGTAAPAFRDPRRPRIYRPANAIRKLYVLTELGTPPGRDTSRAPPALEGGSRDFFVDVQATPNAVTQHIEIEIDDGRREQGENLRH